MVDGLMDIVPSCTGAVGGSIWHAIKGARNAPKGWSSRFYGSMIAMKTRAPIVGGSFAIWGGVFASFDCTIAYIRQKVSFSFLCSALNTQILLPVRTQEDAWNAITSGALTGGVLAIRSGPKAAMRNAIAGGVILAVIEGVGLWISRVPLFLNAFSSNSCSCYDVVYLSQGLMPMLEQKQMQEQTGMAGQELPLTPPGFGGSFGGLVQSRAPQYEEPLAPAGSVQEGFDVDSALQPSSELFDSNAGDPYARYACE